MKLFVYRGRGARGVGFRNRYVQADGGPTFFVDWHGRPHLVVRTDGHGDFEQPLRVEAKELERLGAPADPIQLPILRTFEWATKAHAQESLERLGRTADRYAQKQIDWYARSIPRARSRARMIRVVVILTTAAAGLIPILSQLIQTDGKPDIAPAWSSVALAAAAALVGLDRYFGFSQSWMRYTTARQRLEALQERFAVDWPELSAQLDDPPSRQQINAVVARARKYVGEVGAIVDQETAEWLRTMSAALHEEESVARTDGQREEKSRSVRQPAKVTVSGEGD